MGMVHGIADVVHELERVRAEQEKQTALLQQIANALAQRDPRTT